MEQFSYKLTDKWQFGCAANQYHTVNIPKTYICIRKASLNRLADLIK